MNAVHLDSGVLRATCAIVWPRRIFSNMAEGSESQPNNPLSRKLNKILETRLDNDKVKVFLYPYVFSWQEKKVNRAKFVVILQEMVEALKALSTFFADNSLRSRRNLRGNIEKRSLAINESFEIAFREVKQVRDKKIASSCLSLSQFQN